MKDKASSVIVGVADNNLTRGGHILHEQEYNTGHGVSAIPDEVRGEIRRQPCQPKVQQEHNLRFLRCFGAAHKRQAGQVWPHLLFLQPERAAKRHQSYPSLWQGHRRFVAHPICLLRGDLSLLE